MYYSRSYCIIGPIRDNAVLYGRPFEPETINRLGVHQELHTDSIDNPTLGNFLVGGICCLLFRNTLLAPCDLLSKFILEFARLPRLHVRLEHYINFFKRPTRRLGIHEEHMEGHHRAEHAEDDVGLPLDVGEGGSDEVGQGEVEDPVTRGRKTDTLSTVLQGEHFRGVNPGGRGLCSC